MTPGKVHAKVEALKAARQQAINRLYSFVAGGRTVPTYTPEIMAEKMSAIEDKYDADLRALMDAAEAQATAADAILARVDRPYEWLDAVEMARAATLAPFVREDFATLDAAGLVQAVQTAGGAGKSEQWLALRYAAARYTELDRENETALGMGGKAHYTQAVKSLRESVMPATARRERAAAEAERRDAQDLHDAAEWARPEVRQEFAVKMHVNVEHLP